MARSCGPALQGSGVLVAAAFGADAAAKAIQGRLAIAERLAHSWETGRAWGRGPARRPTRPIRDGLSQRSQRWAGVRLPGLPL